MHETIPERMCAVLLTGHGGFDRLHFREDVPVPRPGAGEVLVEVAAAGVNNTDVNTRIGWYSKQVRDGSGPGGARGLASIAPADASWTGMPLRFPRIQGADCCGHVVAVGEGVPETRIGERVVVSPLLRHYRGFRPFEADTLGSEIDGAFAQYVKTPASETHAVECGWSEVELASIPCAASTAENMLHRARLGAERVLVTGASGGVGSAAVQLARRRGAHVIAQAAAAKAGAVRALGADETIDRDADVAEALGGAGVDVVVDVVGGPAWPRLLDALRTGGRYVGAGAIAGIQQALGRGGDHGKGRSAVLDQGDVDRELTALAQKLPGAVQLVHQPEAAPRAGGQAAGGGAFLGDDGDARIQADEMGDEDALGLLVGLGHRRAVGLAPGRRPPAQGHDGGRRFVGRRDQRR